LSLASAALAITEFQEIANPLREQTGGKDRTEASFQDWKTVGELAQRLLRKLDSRLLPLVAVSLLGPFWGRI
jgi:hypothetical protein